MKSYRACGPTVTSLPASQRSAHGTHQVRGRQGYMTPVFSATPVDYGPGGGNRLKALDQHPVII